jgi:hypothetical protein
MPLLITWKQLKALGWPYSPTHTERLMAPELKKTKGSRFKGTYKEWIEPNPNPFPPAKKLFDDRNSTKVWEYHKVIEYFKSCGIEVPPSVTFEVQDDGED